MLANPLTERRLFVRRAVDGVEIDWNIDHNRRRSRWGARKTPRVKVLDISAGGICVLAPRDDHLVRGTPLVIGEELMTGLVAVRWSLPAEERGLARFGLEYIELSYELEAYLMEPLSDRESPFVEVGWTQ